MSSRTDLIQQKLSDALTPTHIDVLDDSQSHAGHAGAIQSGGGHFYLTIVSDEFESLNRIKRHQKIYEILGDMMHNEIHALSIKAYTPNEYSTSQD